MKGNTSMAKASADLIEGLLQYKLWMALGWQDIKKRYRRSVLGPFWLTLSTAIFVVAMGPLYGLLLRQPISDYVPFVAASIIAWYFVNALITESCAVFTGADGYIKQTRLPVSLFVFQMIWRNFIIFMHNFVIMIPVYFFTSAQFNVNIIYVVAGIFLLMINSVWFGLMLGMMCVRFRDVPMIVASLLQVAFFLTPVFWKPQMLGSRQWVAHINPLYHMLELIRAPMLGQAPPMSSWYMVIGMAFVGMGAAFLMFSRFRSRIPYWA